MAEKILQSVTDKTTQYTITESEFWKLNEVAASMDEIGRLGGVDTNPMKSTFLILARRFFDVLEPISERRYGGDPQDTEHPLIAKVRDVIETGDNLHVDALDKLLDGYGLCPDEHPKEGGAA